MRKYNRIIAFALVLICIASAFSACSKKNEAEPSTEQGMYYDRNGVEAKSREEILYYDKDGNVFMLEIVEDYMPDYVNQQTGERYNGFECYITEDGYFYHDAADELKLVSGTTDTYKNPDGKQFFDISTVYWDMNGNMFRKSVK